MSHQNDSTLLSVSYALLRALSVYSRERLFWQLLSSKFHYELISNEWMIEEDMTDFICPEIAIFWITKKRRGETQPEQRGSNNISLDPFFNDYPNEQQYLTKEEVDQVEKQSKSQKPG